MNDLIPIPPEGSYSIVNASIPDCSKGGGPARKSLAVKGGKIVDGEVGQILDARGGIILPAFTDMHTHLDKGHIWPRSPNLKGDFDSALSTVADDRATRWSADDVRRRMDFALRCAYAHGTGSIRTHLDSVPPQHEISWPVFREIRIDWSGRIELQAVTILGIENVSNEAPFLEVADVAAESGGVLGCVTYPIPDAAERIDSFFRIAMERGMSADLHVDETEDAGSATLRMIAESVLRTGFDAPVAVGHCCSLAMQSPSDADRTLDLVAESGLSVVSLPMCNMYLQDRNLDRTPRWRGVTLVHEMRARGISVSFASDNTRDPFYAYGDLDMLEVMREATRICHLDHSRTSWLDSFTSTPAAACGFEPCELKPGDNADFVVFRARNCNELLSRPQHDRVVVRSGQKIFDGPPCYSELDDLME